jgi:hypothetical protein
VGKGCAQRSKGWGAAIAADGAGSDRRIHESRARTEERREAKRGARTQNRWDLIGEVGAGVNSPGNAGGNRGRESVFAGEGKGEASLGEGGGSRTRNKEASACVVPRMEKEGRFGNDRYAINFSVHKPSD